MDGEIERFTFTTHSIKKDKDIVYNTSKSVFHDIGNSEWYKTSGLKEIGIIYGTTENSYRKTSELINRIRYQEGVTPVRTLRENTAAEGTKISDFVEQKTTHILKINNFTSEAIPKNKVEINEPILILQEEVEKAIEECDLLPEEVAEIEKSPLVYESPKDTVNIFLDEVMIKDRYQLEVLINYIERNREYIPCYGVRKNLGLRNSSNIGEKTNDLIVSNRQKHNGMSWSKDGSISLACVAMIKRNKEYKNWFEKGELVLKLVT